MAEHHPENEHVHGNMDITEHEKMFAAFMKFWVYLFGGSILILVFLALFNS